MSDIDVIKISAVSNIDTSGLDKLSSSLSKLKMPKEISGKINDLASSIGNLSSSLQSLNTQGATNAINILQQFGNLKVKIPPKVEERVNSVKKAFEDLGDTKNLYKNVNSYTRIMAQFKDLGSLNGLRNLAKGIKEVEQQFNTLNFRRVSGEVNSLTRIFSPLADVMFKIATSMTMMKSFKWANPTPKGEGSTGKTKDTSTIKGTISKEGADKTEPKVSLIGKAFTLVIDKIKQANEALKPFFDKIAVGEAYVKKLGEAMSPLLEKIAKIGSVVMVVVQAFKKLWNIATKVAKVISSLDILNPFKGLAKSISEGVKKLKAMFNALKRIAIYRALRKLLKEIAKGFSEGIENLYHYSEAWGTDFAPALDKIATAMLYLKNSVGAMVSPLITYFAPAIDYCTDKLVEFLNVINQLFAKLTGRSQWTKAIKYPTKWAEETSKASKKVKDNLQDFDELHILRTDNGGAGADALDYSKMFEEVDLDTDFAKWMDDFKTAIQQGDWAGAGDILGNSINSMFSSVDWEKLGTDTATKINNVFSFAYSTLKTMDFTAIGSDIATFLNKAINSLNTELIGKTFARKWTAIIDFLYGFVSTFDFTTFGTKVSQFVEGWFKEIDGGRIGETVSKIIVGIFKAGIAFLSNEKMLKEFAKDISDFFNNLDVKGIISNAIKFIKTLAFAIGTVVVDIFKNVEWGKIFSEARDGIIEGLRSAVGVDDSDGTAVGRRDTQGVFVVGNQVIQKPDSHIGHGFSRTSQQTNTLPEHKKSIPWETIGWSTLGVNALADLANIYKFSMKNVKDYSALGVALEKSATISKTSTKKIVSDTKSMNKNVTQSYTDMATNINERLTETYDTTSKEHETISKNVSDSANNIKSSMTNAMTSVNDKTRSTTSNITSMFRTVTTSATADLTSMKTSAISTYDGMAKGIVTPLNTFKSNTTTAFENTKTSSLSKITSLKTSVVNKFGDMDTDVQKKIGNFKNDWSTKFGDVKTSLVNTASDIKSGITGAFDDAKSGGVSAMKSLREDILTPFNGVISSSEGMSNGVISGMNKVIDAFKKFHFKIPDWIADKSLAGKEWKVNVNNIDSVKSGDFGRLKLARGGVVTSPTNALIGEAGREAVLPLDRNTTWMDDLAERIDGNKDEEIMLLREQNSYLAEIARKEFGISSRAIFDTVRKENSNYYMRTGKSLLAT